jgi:hypothetical protein
VFDTETNGIPPKSKTGEHKYAPYREWNECRMLQLAWVILKNDPGGLPEVLHRGNVYLLPPPEYPITEESKAIHGITEEEIQEMSAEMRPSRAEALSLLFKAIEDYRVETIVAHNLEFDYHILINEIQRSFPVNDPRRSLYKERWMALKGFCTHRHGKKYLRWERERRERERQERERRERRERRELCETYKPMPYVSGKLTSFYSYFVEPFETSPLSLLRLHRAECDVELTWRLYHRLYGMMRMIQEQEKTDESV